MDYAVAQTSLAHTYGNVTCFITDYVKSLFPKNYFKTVHIATTIAYKQFSIFQNSNKEFLKKSKPMLIVRPRIEMDDSSVFLYDTYMTTNTHNTYNDISFTNLQPFVNDKETGNWIKFLLNRLKMTFDISIITETYMDALNQAHMLKNRLPFNYYLFLPTSLESYIPRDLLKLVGESVKVPLYDNNGSVAPFLEYINSHSEYPVSYKMKNSTGNDEFFRYYPVNIDTTFSGLSVEDPNKKGQVVDASAVQFQITAEFNAAGLYYFFTRKTKIIDTFIADLTTENRDRIIPIFTQNNLYAPKYGYGWNVYCAPMYKVDDIADVDVMDISSLFNNSILYVLKYHNQHSIPLDIVIKAEVMKDGRNLTSAEYEVDFDKLQLTTKNCNIGSTYRLIIHVNTNYINNLLNETYDLSREK